ncbi:nucleotidyltransferase family protein [Serratia sp. NPDC078593]|uniref:nucleotidyltransferase family protein n=1 Tax=unclassified Serratia (in: enterobacteria) TaxID=2647522 RepID=UPI0037D1C947
MTPQQHIFTWLQQDADRMAALRTARRLGLNDWCLGAGFVRNLVWDRLHDFHAPTALNDIDVIHFDVARPHPARDRMLETRLQQWLPLPWSVKNQARMHLRVGRAPYLNTEDAISFWPEVETAVGVRLNADDSLSLIAPFGLHALFAQTLTFNAKNGDVAAFQHRVTRKRWLQQWPRLKIRHR